MSRNQFSIGDVVVDSHEEDDVNPAIVVNQPSKRADEWVAYADTTVAEDNPEYPDGAKLAVVGFYGEMTEHAEELLWPESPIPINELNGHGVKDYAFPVGRLERVEDPDFDCPEPIGSDQTTDASDDSADTDDEPDTEAVPRDDAVDQPDTDTEDADTQQDLEVLQDYLKENGVRSEIEEETVVVDKLGQIYRLVPGNVVEGDGPYRDRLEQLVDEAPV